jgi:solute carrier family 35 protein C2
MTSDQDGGVARWLYDQQQSVGFTLTTNTLHPADVFPLATISNPSSSSAASDIDSDSSNSSSSNHGHGGHLHASSAADVATLVHPPTPSMDEQPATNSTRRRSSSLVGAPGASHSDNKKKQRRSRGDKIPEEGEDVSESDSEHSDDSGRTESTDHDHELDDMRSDDGLEDDEETGLTGRDRRRRRRRKRRNTHLDQRIVEDVKYSKEEEKLADANLLHDMLINAVLIGLW